jgi:hypothetical protein
MSYLTYNPAASKYPIREFSNPNLVKSPDAAILGFSYWRFSYNGLLSELQFDLGDGLKTFSVANGVSSFTAGANITAEVPSFAALSDGILGTSNNQRVGTAAGTTYCEINAVFEGPVSIMSLGYYPQAANALIYNLPGTIRIAPSIDGIVYQDIHEQQISTTGLSVSSTNFSAQGLIQNALNVFNLP